MLVSVVCVQVQNMEQIQLSHLRCRGRVAFKCVTIGLDEVEIGRDAVK